MAKPFTEIRSQARIRSISFPKETCTVRRLRKISKSKAHAINKLGRVSKGLCLFLSAEYLYKINLLKITDTVISRIWFMKSSGSIEKIKTLFLGVLLTYL